MFSDPIFVHEDSGLSCNFHREVHLIVSLCKRKQKCQESDLLPLLYVNWKLNFPVNEKWMVQKQNNFYFHFRHIVFHVLTRATCKLTRGLNILETSSGSINWVMKQVRPLVESTSVPFFSGGRNMVWCYLHICQPQKNALSLNWRTTLKKATKDLKYVPANFCTTFQLFSRFVHSLQYRGLISVFYPVCHGNVKMLFFRVVWIITSFLENITLVRFICLPASSMDYLNSYRWILEKESR